MTPTRIEGRNLHAPDDNPMTRIRESINRPPAWTEDAACVQIDPDLHFPHPGDNRRATQARDICRKCPVLEQCARAAIDAREQDGIWGGLLPKERANVIKAGPVRFEAVLKKALDRVRRREYIRQAPVRREVTVGGLASTIDIARHLGLHPSTVRARIDRLGLASEKYEGATPLYRIPEKLLEPAKDKHRPEGVAHG